MSLGRDDLDVFHSDAAQLVGHIVGRFLDVRLVLFEGADAGNAEEIFQFAQETLLIIAGKIDCGRCHRRNPFCDLGRQSRRTLQDSGSRVQETNQYSANLGEAFTTEGTEIHRGEYVESQKNLAGENGARSNSGVRPSTTAAITSAVIGARRMPSRKWPVAT